MDNRMKINRAKALAAMGMVERDHEGFSITSPGVKKEVFRVYRNLEGRVCCTCPEFEEQSQADDKFRCEHILAVKFHLDPPNANHSTDKTPESRRTPVPEESIEQAIGEFREMLNFRLKEKGGGAYASRHEVLGQITEEYAELIEAVHSKSLDEVKKELFDIAVACIFGAACIDAGTLDW